MADLKRMVWKWSTTLQAEALMLFYIQPSTVRDAGKTVSLAVNTNNVKSAEQQQRLSFGDMITFFDAEVRAWHGYDVAGLPHRRSCLFAVELTFVAFLID